jgi:hypothetical protein
MTEFIGVYENAFSKEYCEKVIQYFEDMSAAGHTVSRQKADSVSKILKEDDACFSHSEDFINLQNTKDLHREFNETFWKIYSEQYGPNFAVLQKSGEHRNYAFKIQKTPIGGGYHVWHFEAMNRTVCHRLLTWSLYLNDVEEGGEVEFLYQHKRIKAKQGTLVIFPASFTHTHRGNPPISNDKYIVTGWTEF